MTPEKLSELFNNYDRVTVEITRIEALASSLTIYPSQVIGDLTDLYLQKWYARRAINSAFEELERQKPLWKRIFKK